MTVTCEESAIWSTRKVGAASAAGGCWVRAGTDSRETRSIRNGRRPLIGVDCMQTGGRPTRANLSRRGSFSPVFLKLRGAAEELNLKDGCRVYPLASAH